MRYRFNEDPFFKKQPEKAFIKDLTAPVHADIPSFWNKRNTEDGEIMLDKIRFEIKFPDAERLLETAYADFRSFIALAGISESEDGFSFTVECGDVECKEAYTIAISACGVKIIAGDTDGVRRALIYIEDEMYRRDGTFLPIGEIKRKPFVKTRISRCFFSPPSHSSNEGLVNELASDIDYYPDNYLQRLAHDGINGLWLGANFRDILKSSVIPEFGQDSERRLKKLNEVVEKCRRYGIGIYLYSVEPASEYENPDFKKHTELHGGTSWPGSLFCTSTELGEKYVREAATELFTRVPHLKGFVNITTGECCSACGSSDKLNCPRCMKKHKTLARTLAATEKLFADAIHAVNPEAEFISWTYAQRGWRQEDVKEACEARDTGVIHMQNFEDLGEPVQLGKKRLATDYWLSYAGPGKLMERTAEINKRRGIKTFAKIQACSSHEISSVPYVPAPGILYDKYKYMHENGISGVLQCWYFGNYPCLMNKAACELAFEPFFGDKKSFLKNLAGIYWGADAEKAVKAWELFEKGYTNFPVSVSFEWYGPMQDSVAVPLHLKPVDLPMPATWLVKDMPGSDRIGDALLEGHTIEEADELLSIMSKHWNEGNKALSEIQNFDTLSKKEQLSVSAAIDILFRSGYNIVNFYLKRRLLGIGNGDNAAILADMKKIVIEEIENSAKLIELCKNDSRLGYHSEANGYKFFPEKLTWRIGELKTLLETEFPEVEERIANGLKPLAFYYGEEEEAKVYTISEKDIKNAEKMAFVTENGEESLASIISVSEENGVITLRFELAEFDTDSLVIYPEFRMFHPAADITLNDGKLVLFEATYNSFFGEKVNERYESLNCKYYEESGKAIYELSFKRESFGMELGEPFRLAAKRTGKHNDCLLPPDRVYTMLTLGHFSPDAYCFFINGNNA